MLVLLIILSVGLLGLVIYFAVSPKSSRQLKLAAFIALGLIALAIAVCGIFLFMGPGAGTEQIPLQLFQETQTQIAEDSNILEIIVFLLIFLIVLGLIVGLTFRAQHKKAKEEKMSKKSNFSNQRN